MCTSLRCSSITALAPTGLPKVGHLETGDVIQVGRTQGHLYRRKVGIIGRTKASLILARILRSIPHKNPVLHPTMRQSHPPRLTFLSNFPFPESTLAQYNVLRYSIATFLLLSYLWWCHSSFVSSSCSASSWSTRVAVQTGRYAPSPISERMSCAI